MKKAYYYLYYRVVKLYEDWGTRKGWTEELGIGALFSAFGFLASSLALILLNTSLDEINLFNTIMLPIYGIGLIRSYKDVGVYETLKEYYKNEKHPKTKNVLTMLCILSAPIIFGIVAFIVR